MSNSVIPWIAACQASLSVTISWCLLKLMSIESVMPYNHLILCHSLLLLSSIFPRIWVFSNEANLHIKCPNIGASASASVLPMNIQCWFPLRLTSLIPYRYSWKIIYTVSWQVRWNKRRRITKREIGKFNSWELTCHWMWKVLEGKESKLTEFPDWLDERVLLST